LARNRQHVVVNYGTFALPIGPRKLLFGKSSGIAARLIENWQASWIVNLSSGAPGNISAQSMLYSLGVPDIVGPFDIKDVRSSWANGAAAGNLFSDGNNQPLYTKVRDPQCTNGNYVAPSLSGFCTLNALRNSSGQIVLQTPLPGNRGTFGQNRLENLGTWTADMASKNVFKLPRQELHRSCRCDECVQSSDSGYQRRILCGDWRNSRLEPAKRCSFGIFNNKIGNRRFQLKARVDF